MSGDVPVVRAPRDSLRWLCRLRGTHASLFLLSRNTSTGNTSTGARRITWHNHWMAPAKDSFSALGLADAVVATLTALGMKNLPGPARDDSADARQPRSPGPGRDRHRKDGGVCAAHDPGSRPGLGTRSSEFEGFGGSGRRPRSHARARDAGVRGDPSLRPRHGPHRRPPLWRVVHAAADPRPRARRRHRRRDAGPRARSHPPQDARTSTRCASSSSTKLTKCSTWASPEDIETMLEQTPRHAADGVVFGDDAGADSQDRRAPPEEAGAGRDCAREDRRGQAAARPPGRLHRPPRRRSRRRSTASWRWRTRRPPLSSAARASRWTRSPRRSTPTATAPRRCTAAWNSASATP